MKQIKNFNIRTDLYYETENGFWLDVKDNIARIGFNPLVQETTGSFVAIKIEDTQLEIVKGESFGSLEAEKHVGYLKMPISGRIILINEKIIENPRLINTDPFSKGWMVEIEMSRFDQEKNELLTGEENVIKWFESEIEKYEDKGWLAESIHQN